MPGSSWQLTIWQQTAHNNCGVDYVEISSGMILKHQHCAVDDWKKCSCSAAPVQQEHPSIMLQHRYAVLVTEATNLWRTSRWTRLQWTWMHHSTINPGEAVMSAGPILRPRIQKILLTSFIMDHGACDSITYSAQCISGTDVRGKYSSLLLCIYMTAVVISHIVVLLHFL